MISIKDILNDQEYYSNMQNRITDYDMEQELLTKQKKYDEN